MFNNYVSVILTVSLLLFTGNYAYSNNQHLESLGNLSIFNAVGFIAASPDLFDDGSDEGAEFEEDSEADDYVDDLQFSIGTGTHIGEGIIISAAHVFEELIPENASTTPGPVVIDVSKQFVVWSPKSDSKSEVDLEQDFRAVKLVVDGRYIAALNSGDALEQDKHDVAFLKLNRVPSDSIILAVNVVLMPDIAMLVGYGKSTDGRKHAVLQEFNPENPFQGWSFLYAESQLKEMSAYVKAKQSREGQCHAILNRPCNDSDMSYLFVDQGDSGGPLIISDGGALKIIGIMSSSDTTDSVVEWIETDSVTGRELGRVTEKLPRHNFYVSLVNGNPAGGGYSALMYSDITSLWNEAKR